MLRETAAVRTAPSFRSAIVKVASRCNLNCSYCYMYNMGDRTFVRQPRLMSSDTIDALVAEIASHCRAHELPTFTIGFHGGEPLLAPPKFYENFVARTREALGTGTMPRFSMQTNGTLLTPAWCDLLRTLEIQVGISIDGPPANHDAQRVDHKGRGSYSRVRRGWDIAVAHGLRPSLLCVLDPEIDPDEMYEQLRDLAPRAVDFLLPQATHDDPPPGHTAGRDAAPYAAWLITMFDLWARDGLDVFRVRLFEQIVACVLGTGGGMAAMGRGLTGVVVIETDGGIEPNDLLRACRPGITRTPLNVHGNRLDEAFGEDMIDTDYYSQRNLCGTCERCEIRDICGGGYLPHRYSASNGFDNPSVYCLDLWRLIAHIQAWTVNQLPDSIQRRAGISAIGNGADFDPRTSQQ